MTEVPLIDKKNFSSDAIFKLINKRFITLKDEDVKRNNVYLGQAIQTITERMKSIDQLFAKTYKEIRFCGSFYKGTKVGKPNEFDINIILELPLKHELCSPRDGFLQIRICNDVDCVNVYQLERSNNSSNKKKKTMQDMVTNDLLDPQKFRSWIEGIINKVVNELPIYGDKHLLRVNKESFFDARIKIQKSGPAFTVKMNIPEESQEISIDLVPVLAFKINEVKPFISNVSALAKCRENPWFAVPIVSVETNCMYKPPQSWRIAFSPQENQILTTYGRLKPVIRQMKKLRDTQNWTCLKSYFIETLFFNKLPELDRDLNSTMSFTYLFYKMLKVLQKACEQRRINYYWDPNFNLLETSGHSEMNNVADRAKRIIKDIENNIMRNSFVLAKYILTGDELRTLSNESREYPDKYNEVNLDDLYAITDRKEVVEDITDDANAQSWRCIIL